MEWEIIEKRRINLISGDIWDTQPCIGLVKEHLLINKLAVRLIKVKPKDLINILTNGPTMVGIQLCETDEERKHGYAVHARNGTLGILQISLSKQMVKKLIKCAVHTAAPAVEYQTGSRIIPFKFEVIK